MGETRKSSWVPSESSGWENSSTTVLEKPARWRGWENIASHNTPRGTILGIQTSISFWCVYHEDLEISWLSVSVLNWKAQTNNHQSGYCLKYTGSAITKWMVATNQPWSGSSQVTSNESWWLQTSSRAVWHRPCYATPEHDSGLPSEFISHRIRQGSSSTPPCTITCCFLVINWIKA